MRMKEMTFWIREVVTGKGNLEWARLTIFRGLAGGANAKVEAHLYVPARMSPMTLVKTERGFRYQGFHLHERVNLFTTSNPESALTAAMARRPLKS